MHPNHRTWRIRGIPRDVDRERLARALRHHSDLRWPGGDGLNGFEEGGNDVIVHTLAPDLRVNYQVATIRFHNFPIQLQKLGAREELPIQINMNPEISRVTERCESASQVVIDEHFDGITTLFSPVTDEEHKIDVLAVSGLGSHPFGSFVNKKDGNMWLTNNLPHDMAAARVMIFGYESKLQNSRSHVELDDLAGPVHFAINQILRSKKRSLLLIGHSLGGLLVKEALIRIAEPGSKNSLPNLLDMIAGVLLFGTPNDGLDIESLVPMVNDQPNRSLLESLNSKSSQVLRRQKQQFSKVLEHSKFQLFCLYETELSPTAAKDPATGRWKMDGPHRFLVSQPSATSCLPAGGTLTHSVPIRRNHSDLVKFSSHDAEYDKVSYVIKEIENMSISHRAQEREFQFPRITREPQKRNSVITGGQEKRLTGESHAHNLTKRSVDNMLSPSVGKRPRLVNHSLENDQAETADDTARDPVVQKEMIKVKKELIRRLYFSKIDERLTHLTPAQGTTCRWFLAQSKYQSWRDATRQSEHGGFLWIKGNPGTGKSTLMKLLFEETKVKSRNDPSQITLSFFFLARGTAEEKTTGGLYRSLLHQLFEIAPDLEKSLDWMTLDGARTIKSNGWSEEALKHTLKHAVPKLGSRSLTVFVDALDECDADKADDMVSFFEELCDCAIEARVQLRICFSSRYYPTIVINKGLEVRLEGENGHTEDIRNYVNLRLRLKGKSKPEHANALRSEIVEKSSGIFLWAALVLDILNNENSISIQKLRDHLKEIPPRLDDLFQMILTRDGDNLEQLRLCLNWVLFASHALEPQELYFAIQLGTDKECSGFWDRTDLDQDDMKNFVRSCSKGLAEVTWNEDSEAQVQFIHESVRDFLLGNYGNQWSGTSENLEGYGHQVLMDCCLAQMNASISQQIEMPDHLPPASDEQAAQLSNNISWKYPFLGYSVHNAFYHSNLAQRNGIGQEHFLSDFHLQQWISLHNIISQGSEQYEILSYTNSASLIYILGEKNLGDLIRIHPRRKFCFQMEAERYGAPILAALAHNSHEAIKTFLWALAENEPPTSPLHGLCEHYERHRDKWKTSSRDLILTGADGVQVLLHLVEENEEALALAFILSPYGLGEPLDPSDETYLKLLSLAVSRAHGTLFRLLLQGCPRIYLTNEWLNSMMPEAADRGSEAIVKLLLERGADIQTSRHKGYGPLFNAVRNGNVAVVKVLLDSGVNVDLKSEDGIFLLYVATSRSHVAVIKLLLERGVVVGSHKLYGKEPLWTAVRNGDTTVFKLLLEKCVDIEVKMEDGETALSFAARRGQSAAVKFLLEKGADVESRDHYGRTPLSRAAGGTDFEEDIAKLLLEEGADINSRDYVDERTPLSWAAGNVNHGEEITRVLVERGADVDSRDRNGRTPLLWAAVNSKSGPMIAGLLLEKGADIESRDNRGRTSLSWAAGNCTAGAVHSLLNGGANIDSQDKDGRTPLSWALSNPYPQAAEAIIALLQEAGGDVESVRRAEGR